MFLPSSSQLRMSRKMLMHTEANVKTPGVMRGKRRMGPLVGRETN